MRIWLRPLGFLWASEFSKISTLFLWATGFREIWRNQYVFWLGEIFGTLWIVILEENRVRRTLQRTRLLPMVPEPTHEHDVEFAGPPKRPQCKHLIVRSCQLYEPFWSVRTLHAPQPIFFNFPDFVCFVLCYFLVIVGYAPFSVLFVFQHALKTPIHIS